MKTQHTPGPLTIRKTGPATRFQIEKQDGTPVAATFSEADARLYSAAPSMFDLLKEATTGCNQIEYRDWQRRVDKLVNEIENGRDGL